MESTSIALNSRMLAQAVNSRLGTRYSYRDIHGRLAYAVKQRPFAVLYHRPSSGKAGPLLLANDFPRFLGWMKKCSAADIAPLTRQELAAVGAIVVDRAVTSALPTSQSTHRGPTIVSTSQQEG